MLSRLLFNLTAVFLIFYISASSATPAAELAGSQKIDNSIDDNSAISVIPAADPAELQNIDNNIDNNIHDRAYRARPYRPYFCQYPYVWQRRECVPSVGPRAWQDVCTHATYATRFEVDYQNIRGLCAENTWCTNIVDEEGKRFVRCVLMAPGKRRREGPQIGASDRKRARPTLDNTQLEFSVKIEDDMKAASVGAVVESEYPPVNVQVLRFTHDMLGIH